MIESQFSFHPVELPNGSSVELALPSGSADPVVNAYAAGHPLNQYLTDLLLRFTKPGDFLLDLGCHVGTLSVPAAALGRHVLAIDASPLHVEAVGLSRRRNQLSCLDVRWCAVAESDGEVAFNENGLWGMVSRERVTPEGMLRVPAHRADALVASAGWPRVDLVKMDVEGSELAAIESLGTLLEGDSAPVVIYESNGMTFELFGYDVRGLRRRLESLGYITCRVEGTRLIYCPPGELQPEAWLDVIALPSKWRASEPVVTVWPREEMIRRCIEWGTNEHRNVREYLHRAFATDCVFPDDDLRIVRLRDRLAAEFDAG